MTRGDDLDTTYRRLMGFALASTLALGLAACGDDDDDDDTSDVTTGDTAAADETTTTTGEATETSAAGSDTTAAGGTEDTAAAGEALVVTGVDYGFEGIPTEPVPVGTSVEFHNGSDAEAHEFVALRIPDDETRSVGELLQLPEEELGALFAGEPAMVLLAGPGDNPPQITAVGDGTFTEAGRYAIICFIQVGADPEAVLSSTEGPAPEDPNAGPPHFVEGMAAELTVE
jgi:hypothetical protein